MLHKTIKNNNEGFQAQCQTLFTCLQTVMIIEEIFMVVKR